MSQIAEVRSSNTRNKENFFLLCDYYVPLVINISETSPLTDVYISVGEEGLTEDEKQQVEKSRRDIAAGKAKHYKNAEEYLKSLDEDQ